jgi:ribulose-phosphate 3-epimerase
VLVAGSALFADPAGLEHAVSDLRAAAHAAR